MPLENKSKTGVLLINLGTPDSTAVKDVRKYLREFLMDRRVIDIPWIRRFFLINFVIAPFRAPESAKGYKKLWLAEGSPLKVYGFALKKALQEALGDDYLITLGMRYQNPPLESALKELQHAGVKKIICIPLYPQYASSSTGSSLEEFLRIIKTWEVIPETRVISQFFNEPIFIESFKERAQAHLAQRTYDHIVFSYHGLPERQIKSSSCQNYCQINDKCCAQYFHKNQYCYRAQCFATSRLLAKSLNIPKESYTVCFQSRLGKTPWIKPYTDEVIVDLARKGVKKVLAFSPSFIADCLETTVEVGDEYKHLFLSNGGERWDLVESLNTLPKWVECLKGMVEGEPNKEI